MENFKILKNLTYWNILPKRYFLDGPKKLLSQNMIFSNE